MPYSHYIFIDTETSGIPERLDIPVTETKQWPAILQLAWIVVDLDGNLVKEENHYLKNRGIHIDPRSFHMHGITTEVLKKNGVSKRGMLKRLYKDIKRFNALLVAHFIEFDMKMLAVENLRLKIPSDLDHLPTFCTMLNSAAENRNPEKTYPSLGTLYRHYFKKPLANEHNALYDARAAAECFLAMTEKDKFKENQIVYFDLKTCSEKKDTDLVEDKKPSTKKRLQKLLKNLTKS